MGYIMKGINAIGPVFIKRRHQAHQVDRHGLWGLVIGGDYINVWSEPILATQQLGYRQLKKKNRKKEQQKKNAFNEVNAQFLMQECHNAGKLIKSTDAIIIIPIKSKKFITDGNMTPLNK